MHSTDILRVGAVQLNCDPGNLDANAENHRRWIDEAHALGLDLLLFPELSLTGYALGAELFDMARTAEWDLLQQLADHAGSLQIMAGFVECAGPGELYNATAVLQHGGVHAVHRKLNLPTYGGLEEGKWFHRGKRVTLTQPAPGWQASTLICADLWNPALVHAAMLQRPDLLCAPINSASHIVSAGFSNEESWPINLRFHAMTYGTPVVMANRYGAEGDHHFWGGSRILGPRGETLAAAPPGESLITAELSRHAIARARFELPTLRDADTALIRTLLDAAP